MAAPDLSIDKIGKNPFTEGLEIKVVKKSFNVLNRFDEKDLKEYELEVVPYTKVFEFTGNRQQVNDLPVRCKEMYLWLIHVIKNGQDIIHIDRVRYMNKMGIGSINTFKEAVRGLCENLYIYPHANPSLKDVFWINPRFIFKGSRLTKYPDNVVVKATVKK